MAPNSDSGSGRPKPGAVRPPSPPSSAKRLEDDDPTPPHGGPAVPGIPKAPPPIPPAQRPPPAGAAPKSPPVASGRPAAPPRPPPLLHTPSKGVPSAGPRTAAPPPPRPAAPPAAAPLDRAQLQELEQRFANLDKMDYFQLLKLEPSAAMVEIKAAFYRESRTLHPDKFFQLPDKQFKEKVSAVYKRLTEAYYVLRDDVKR